MAGINGINKVPMAVNAAHEALVRASSSASELDAILDGNAFRCCVATLTPTGANDFMLFKNISEEFAVLTRFAGYFTAAETFTGSITANYAATGGAVPDTSMNRSASTKALSAKMSVLQAVAITGISAVLSVPLTFTSAATTRYQNILDDGAVIVIPPGHSLTLSASAGGNPNTALKAELYFVTKAADAK